MKYKTEECKNYTLRGRCKYGKKVIQFNLLTLIYNSADLLMVKKNFVKRCISI
jgi:hypothetical protein